MLEAGDEWDILWGRIERLDARERTILVLRYGLEGESPLTLKEIGRRLGVTREWVRKIEVRAVRKLDNNDERELDGRPAAIEPAAAPHRRCQESRPGMPGTVAPPRSCVQLRPRATATLARWARSGGPGSRPRPSLAAR